MLLRFVAAGFVVVATAATAYAQAPGDQVPVEQAPVDYSQPIMAPGYVQPQPVMVAPPVRASVMDNRWAVGLSVGQLTLAPKDSPDQKTDFGVGQLSLRFRATLHLELELALGGGREQLKDGTQGDLETKTAMVALRYRFSAERPWNWWLMGGLGGMQAAPHGSDDQTFKDSERPLGALGIGLERRWTNFALHAELAAVAVGPQKNQDQPVVYGTGMGGVAPGTTTTPPQPQGGSTMTTSDNYSGGQFTIGASYYF
jgi:hypothetical protein